MSRLIENNKVIVIGEILGQFEYSHEIFGEKWNCIEMEVDYESCYSFNCK